MSKSTPTGSPLATAADKKREEAKKSAVQCCVPNCEGVAVTRGLCSRCYSAASKLVGTGEVTWESLEKRGFAKPSKRDPASNKFLEALKQKK